MAQLTIASLRDALRQFVALAPLLTLANVNLPSALVADASAVLGEIDSGRLHDGMTSAEIAVEVAKIATGVGITLPSLLDTAFKAVETYQADLANIEHGQSVIIATSAQAKLPDGKTFSGDLVLVPRGSDVDGVLQGTKVVQDAPS